MKIAFQSLCLFLMISIIACAEKKKELPKKINTILKDSTKIKPDIKKAEKSWDSLHSNNVEAFFTEYEKTNKETKVMITTEYGKIKLRLYNDTPIHRANFIFLTKIKYFDTTVFYRVAKNFVIQGGNSDDEYTMKQRNKYGNYLIKPEFLAHRKHKYGALAAARHWENNPDKLSSPFEFYMVHSKNGAHHLNNQHTVFGEVISGFSTLDKIAEVEVGPDEWPIVDVKMKVEIIE
ncbi:MAG: peptidylprolyl isomerase [Flavobacteriaceae bacterium]|nr:peptidylprolyl isomerase [Flavobacteriaceae bacterium]